MLKYIIIMTILASTSFSSCSIFENSTERRKSAGISRQNLFTEQVNGNILPTLFWSHYDATQRGGLYLAKADGTVKVISENPPDVALNSTIDILAKANVDSKVDAAAKFSAVRAVAELGKRNAANYMIRDLAFRIESLQNNSPTIDSNILKTYHKLIHSAEQISIAEAQANQSNAKSETLQSLTELIKLSKDTTYKDLKLDSNFIKRVSEYIEKE